MAEEAGKTEEHGKLYKAAEIGLGVASVAAIVMSFFPGANEVGAILQGGITLVQTGMELATGHPKQAAKTFAIGALLTIASIIPFLGAVGNFAKFGAAGLKATEGVGAASKALAEGEKLGMLARMGKGIKGAGQTVAKGSKEAFERIPGSGFVKNKIYSPVAGGIKSAGKNVHSAMEARHIKALEWATRHEGIAKAGALVAKHGRVATAAEWGANIGGIGWSMMDGNTPPGNLANDETYNFNDAPQPASRRWQNRIDAERERQALAGTATEH